MGTGGEAILGVCGYKKSGKTGLIEYLVQELIGQGYRVGVVKHAQEGVTEGRADGDTERFRRAGAGVKVFEGEVREEAGGMKGIEEEIRRWAAAFEVVLVEGFKKSGFDKLWLLREGETAEAEGVRGIIGVLEWGAGRPAKATRILKNWLEDMTQ